MEVLTSRDLLYMISEMLPGEYSLSTFPLLCKSTSTARLCLHLSNPQILSSLASSFSSASSVASLSALTSSFSYASWTKETYFFSIPNRHTINSIMIQKLPGSILDFRWLPAWAPQLVNLIINNNTTESGPMYLESFVHTSTLKSLELLQCFAQDVISLAFLQSLTHLRLHLLHCPEEMILNALWRNTTLTSLQLNERVSSVGDTSPPPPTPPGFGAALRQLECTESSTLHALKEHCWQLERLKCAVIASQFVRYFPQLIELTTGCAGRLELQHRSLERVEITLKGVLQGSCPKLKHATLRKVHPTSSLCELLSSCQSLETLELQEIQLADQDQYINILKRLASQFQRLKVRWDGVLPWKQISKLLKGGVQLTESEVVKVAIFNDKINLLPPSYLHSCTTLILNTQYVANAQSLPPSPSLTTIQLELDPGSIADLQQLLTHIPSLTDVDVKAGWNGELTLNSPRLRSLKLRLGAPLVVRGNVHGNYDFNLPMLTKLNVVIGTTGLFIGALLSGLLSNSETIRLPALHAFTASAVKSSSNQNVCKCRVGHPFLRELVLKNVSWKTLRLQNLPALRKVEVDYTPTHEMWLNVPARCIIQVRQIFIKSSIPFTLNDSNVYGGQFQEESASLMMLQVWGLRPETWSLCPTCEKDVQQQHQTKCKHGVVILGVDYNKPMVVSMDVRPVQIQEKDKCHAL